MINVIHAGTARFAAIKRRYKLTGDTSLVYRNTEIRRATLIGADDIVTRYAGATEVVEELKQI